MEKKKNAKPIADCREIQGTPVEVAVSCSGSGSGESRRRMGCLFRSRDRDKRRGRSSRETSSRRKRSGSRSKDKEKERKKDEKEKEKKKSRSRSRDRRERDKKKYGSKRPTALLFLCQKRRAACQWLGFRLLNFIFFNMSLVLIASFLPEVPPSEMLGQEDFSSKFDPLSHFASAYC